MKEDYIYGSVVPKSEDNINDAHDILLEDKTYLLKKQKEEKKKRIIKYKLKLIGNVFLIFLGCLFLMKQYASITSNQKEIKNMKKELEEIQNANILLKSEIAKSIDLDMVKQKAMQELGMVEPSPHQIIYIDVPKISYTAYYEPKQEDEEEDKENFLTASFFDFFNWFKREE
ncbi:FtsB family cell division protein [Defluviitalea phaphyphila]|uniref:FtsB family cell division protein n=1 Tax=Defluviitalea phaphyphila TaxID=1473580 RepID=UPI0007304218|nr:septum formation initiator family protein [Defluviitalea phaphyphila]